MGIGTGAAAVITDEALRRSIIKDLDAAEGNLQLVATLMAQLLAQMKRDAAKKTGTSASGPSQAPEGSSNQQKAPQTTKDGSGPSELQALQASISSDFPLYDPEVAQLADQLRVDIARFALEFFKAAEVNTLVDPELDDYLDLEEPLHNFMATMGAFSEEDIRDWVYHIQDTAMRSRIMRKFMWKFLLHWVFGRFLWMGDLNGAAQRIGRVVFPEEGECNAVQTHDKLDVPMLMRTRSRGGFRRPASQNAVPAMDSGHGVRFICIPFPRRHQL